MQSNVCTRHDNANNTRRSASDRNHNCITKCFFLNNHGYIKRLDIMFLFEAQCIACAQSQRCCRGFCHGGAVANELGQIQRDGPPLLAPKLSQHLWPQLPARQHQERGQHKTSTKQRNRQRPADTSQYPYPLCLKSRQVLDTDPPARLTESDSSLAHTGHVTSTCWGKRWWQGRRSWQIT